MSQRNEYGIEVKTPKPVEELTDDELNDLDSDADLLEGEAEALRKLVSDEMKRRGW